MNKLEKEALKLNSLIKESDEYKEYITCKNLLENSSSLTALKSNIDKEKEEVCKAKKRTKKYDGLLNEYNSNPLVVNYESSKENLKNYLSFITNIISKDL